MNEAIVAKGKLSVHDSQLKFIIVLLTVIVTMLAGWITVRPVSAYSEQNGGWSASEKRQVIDLLERISENTGGN